MSSGTASRRTRSTRERPGPLKLRLELLRLRATVHRMELTSARQELEGQFASLRSCLALVAVISRTVFPSRLSKEGANVPWVRIAALLVRKLIPILFRPLWRLLFAAGRRRREAGSPESGRASEQAT